MKRAFVIGSGWGAHAARALAPRSDIELAGIVGRGSERTRALAAELGVEVHASIPDEQVDLVVVAAGEHAHAALVPPILVAGADVLVTHPVCARATDVTRLHELASEHARVIRTDYTFRLRPELSALHPTEERGALLRVSIEAPGRWLPIALDAAIYLAGQVRSVTAERAYPTALTARAARSPHVFVPTVTLVHRSGTVSTIVPVPHAPPAEPVRVCASFERGRGRATLPRGGADWLALGRRGSLERRSLVQPSAADTDATVHARGMMELVNRFADNLQESDLATLNEEAHLRDVWAALWRTVDHGSSVPVDDEGRSVASSSSNNRHRGDGS